MAKNNIRDVFSRIRSAVDALVSKDEMTHLAEFTIGLIVKRTRLGYGVDKTYGDKKPLIPLSDRYIKMRKGYKNLSEFTAPKRSNLTLTGQMLDSMKVLRFTGNTVVIGPSGRRQGGGIGNAKLAAILAEKGRSFNFVSRLEFQQVLREYRRTFGDLLLKKKLLK